MKTSRPFLRARAAFAVCFSAVSLANAEPSALSGEVLNFAMLDHQGRLHELRRMNGKAVVLFFTANECPVARQSASKLRKLREKFSEAGVEFFMVNSNPADDRKSISKEAADLGRLALAGVEGRHARRRAASQSHSHGRDHRHQHEGLENILSRRD
jgi:cytochrome oxidase Cu insertion factor (SCO1/SenC/PrrC family)